MNRISFGIFSRCLGIVLAGLMIMALTMGGELQAAPKRSDVPLKMGGLQMPFIQNHGQVDAQVSFYAQTFGGTLFVTRTGGLVLPIPGIENSHGVVIRESLCDAQIVDVRGSVPSSTGVNYFKGRDSKQWRTGVKTFDAVSLGQVYPGIHMRLKAYAENVEKIFDVAPGADPTTIKVRVQGAKKISIDDQGRLELHTPDGPVHFTRPKAFQETADGRRWVDVAYVLKGDTYSFKLGDYDPGQALVIDPLLQSTYLGGSSDHETVHAFALPSEGGIYVAGSTRSPDFPAPPPGAPMSYQPVNAGGDDAYVAILERDLSGVIQMTYVGTANGDTCHAMAIHPTSGQVYIAGSTGALDFPGTFGGVQSSNGGDSDFFAARLSADLTTLHQSTYLGGATTDYLSDMAIHPISGEVYLLGRTQSPYSFPGTGGGADAVASGYTEAVLARLNADLADPEFYQATYIGGSSGDGGQAEMAIHPINGDIYVTGNTYSDDLPITAAAAQPAFAGIRDAFVARINPALTNFEQITYYGGSGVEFGTDIAIHPTSGKVYISGPTYSIDLPNRAGGLQPDKNFDSNNPYFRDGFVARLDAALATIERTTYLGGSEREDGTFTIAFHPTQSELYLAGPTYSDDFPGTSGGAEDRYKYASDAFIARLSLDLTTLAQATYLGGHSGDDPTALGIDPVTGNVYVGGETSSDDFVGVAGGIQETPGSIRDIYLAVFDSSLAADPTAPDVAVAPLVHDFGDLEVGVTSAASVFTISNTGSANLTVSGITNPNGADFSLNTSGGASGCGDAFVLLPGTTCTFTAAFTPASQGALSATVAIASDDPDQGSLQVALSGNGMPVGVGDPDIGVTPDIHAFGDVEVGLVSAETAFTITNTGSADLTVSSIDNFNTTDFSLNTSGGTAGCGDAFVLAPGAACTITAGFAPASQGELATTVTIASDDPDEGTFRIDLTGVGIPASAGDPDIQVDPMSHDFGALEVGGSGSGSSCTISNTGSADLSVTEITSTNTTDFTLNTGGGPAPCGDAFVLPPAGECTFGVSFRPGTVGDFTAILTIHSDDPDESALDITLQGRGAEDDDTGGGGGSGIACFIGAVLME